MQSFHEDQAVSYNGRRFRIYQFTTLAATIDGKSRRVVAADIYLDPGDAWHEGWSPEEELVVPLHLISASNYSGVQ